MKTVKKSSAWSRRNSLIVTLPLAATTILYLVEVYLPLQRSIADVRAQCKHTELMLQQAQRLGGTIGTRQNELDATRQYAAQHLGTLPSVQAAVDSLGEIALLADQSGAQMDRFEPVGPNELEYLARVPVSLTCSGEFAKLFDFLSRLETLPRKVWIEELRFEGPREAGKAAHCELKLVVFAKRSGNSD